MTSKPHSPCGKAHLGSYPSSASRSTAEGSRLWLLFPKSCLGMAAAKLHFVLRSRESGNETEFCRVRPNGVCGGRGRNCTLSFGGSKRSVREQELRGRHAHDQVLPPVRGGIARCQVPPQQQAARRSGLLLPQVHGQVRQELVRPHGKAQGRCPPAGGGEEARAHPQTREEEVLQV